MQQLTLLVIGAVAAVLFLEALREFSHGGARGGVQRGGASGGALFHFLSGSYSKNNKK